MSLPTSEPLPDDEVPIPPAHRRRGRRQYMPAGNDQRTVFLENLAHRATPSASFFPYSLLSGLIFGAGIILKSPPILVLAALIAPFMGPAVGLSLATTVGSGRFFLTEFGATLTGAALVLLGGYGSGWAARALGVDPQVAAAAAVGFSWPELLLLTTGAVVITLSMVRSSLKPVLPSVAIAYPLYIPIAAGGVAAAAGDPGIFLNGLFVFTIFLAWSVLFGTLALVFQGIRPVHVFGYTLGVAITLTCLTLLIGLSGLGMAVQDLLKLPVLPAAVVEPTPTATPAANTPTASPSVTPAPTQITPTATHTLIPTRTATLTPTLSPTPMWAVVNAPASDGAYLRAEPNSTAKILTSLLNGTLVTVLPDVAQEGNTYWSHVKTNAGIEGWIVQILLETATPSASW